MRTNIEIDDELMKQALHLSGLPTKRAVVHAALEEFVRVRDVNQRIRDARRLITAESMGTEWLADYEAHRIR